MQSKRDLAWCALHMVTIYLPIAFHTPWVTKKMSTITSSKQDEAAPPKPRFPPNCQPVLAAEGVSPILWVFINTKVWWWPLAFVGCMWINRGQYFYISEKRGCSKFLYFGSTLGPVPIESTRRSQFKHTVCPQMQFDMDAGSFSQCLVSAEEGDLQVLYKSWVKQIHSP